MDGDKVSGNGTAVAPEAQADRITDAPAAEKPDASVARMTKRLKVIEKVGHKVKAKVSEIAQQETLVAGAKATLDSRREVLHALERDRDGLLEDLTNLSNGGFSERFDFPDPAKPKKNGSANGVAAAKADEAWRSMKIADLTPALKPAKLKALAEHEPRIVTMGDMADFQQNRGEWWWKDIKGLGDSGVEQYADAASQYWKDHPQKQPEKPAATLSWHVRQADGACYASNTAGVVQDGAVATFYIDPRDDGRFDLSGVESLMGEITSVDFATVDEAKAAAEKLNADLAANPPAEPKAKPAKKAKRRKTAKA